MLNNMKKQIKFNQQYMPVEIIIFLLLAMMIATPITLLVHYFSKSIYTTISVQYILQIAVLYIMIYLNNKRYNLRRKYLSEFCNDPIYIVEQFYNEIANLYKPEDTKPSEKLNEFMIKLFGKKQGPDKAEKLVQQKNITKWLIELDPIDRDTIINQYAKRTN